MKKLELCGLAVILFVVAMISSGCNRQETSGESNRSDSEGNSSERASIAFDTINVALFPAEDALPMLYANEWGILDSVGIKANFLVYRSQMDAEQALSIGKAHVGMSDLFRTVWMQGQKKPVAWLFSCGRKLFLVPDKILRLSSVSQMGDHIIASSRFSMDDYYLDQCLSKAGKSASRNSSANSKSAGTASGAHSVTLRSQINSLPLRLSMLMSHQVDAAVLNDFQARKAFAQGYKSIGGVSKGDMSFGGYACNSQWAATHVKDLRRLRQAYEIASKRLSAGDTLPALHDMPTLLKPVNNKPFSVGIIQHGPVPDALNWMRSQGAVSSAYHPDTLFFHLPN